MDTSPFCTVCEHRSAAVGCGHCGAAVCRLCFDTELDVCRECAERVKADGRRGDTFTL